MSGTLFEGIHYYIQSRGIDPDLLQAYGTNLNLNGAVHCDNPCDSQSQLILVDTPTGETKFIYNAHGKLDNYEEKKRTGDWDFDALCTHFSRRGTGIPDIHKERRKKVVGVGWIVECLSQNKLLIDNRYDLWEVIAEDSRPREMPTGRPLIPGQNAPSTLSRPSCDNRPAHRGGQQPLPRELRSMRPIDLHIDKTHSLAAQETTPTPTLLSSTPTPIDWVKMPPSPPLTAASSMSAAGMWSVSKFFSPFTKDPYSPRTFFVACQNRIEVELSITTHGGMLDDQRDATFIIVDAVRLGDGFPRSTWNLLGNLSRSQKPVSPLWIDKCIRRGTVVDLDQYIIRSSSTVPPTMRQPMEVKTTDSEVPYQRGEKPTDVKVPYKHASTPLALGVTATFERKRRLSQSNVCLPDDMVRVRGIIRKAVDPRVRPRYSTGSRASGPEPSAKPSPSISPSVPAKGSPIILKQETPFFRTSIYDQPGASTLGPDLTGISLGAVKGNTEVETPSPTQISTQGLKIVLRLGQSVKPATPNGAVETISSPHSRKAYRPDTPPLPPTCSENPGSPPSCHLAHRGAIVAPESRQRLGSAASTSFQSTLNPSRPETSAYDDQGYDAPSPSSSGISDYTPSLDGGAASPTRLGGTSASLRPATLRSTQARLVELVDELDKWLSAEPVDTAFLFLKALDVKKPGYGWKNHYYRMRRTVRRLLLARHHSATKLDHHRIYDRPDKGRTHVAPDQADRESATALTSLSSIAISSSDQVHIGDGDSDAVDRNGRFHPREASGERRLKKLISYLDQWLHSGFQGTRMNAIKELEAEAPEVGWTNLYYRKAFTIRTRLLDIGWLEVVLDEADIVGKSDRVRGPR